MLGTRLHPPLRSLCCFLVFILPCNSYTSSHAPEPQFHQPPLFDVPSRRFLTERSFFSWIKAQSVRVPSGREADQEMDGWAMKCNRELTLSHSPAPLRHDCPPLQ
ncbi:hypothetical protein DPEC_G00302320 [Dallia pectoralis]|uniref:Uncharacterized protein n=1 Tax=Dallia pectoralis TaxID=75939 RepID=A0ACC2FGY1_DALPE|nr:hypothetical protein DPEC_G00302320 [Dallia pectoralis]